MGPDWVQPSAQDATSQIQDHEDEQDGRLRDLEVPVNLLLEEIPLLAALAVTDIRVVWTSPTDMTRLISSRSARAIARASHVSRLNPATNDFHPDLRGDVPPRISHSLSSKLQSGSTLPLHFVSPPYHTPFFIPF